jgi:hypothetical protein
MYRAMEISKEWLRYTTIGGGAFRQPPRLSGLHNSGWHPCSSEIKAANASSGSIWAVYGIGAAPHLGAT